MLDLVELGSINLLVVGTGGTIASALTERGVAPEYGARRVIEEAVGTTVLQNLKLSYLDLMKIDSSLMTPERWVAIARAIHDNYDNYDAFLVLHGTDTMAYTTSAISFALRGLRKPVVFTGSMRSLREADSDAPRNTADSLIFAREAVELGISGVFLVFRGRVILGVRASKISAVDLDAFTSVNYPYVAAVSELGVEVRHVPRRFLDTAVPRLDPAFDSNVLVLKAFPGMRPEFIDVVVSSGVRGLVLEAFGLGGLPEAIIEKVGEISEEIPVVVTTQPTFGGVDLSVYEVGRRLLNTKVIPACDMSKECAVVKLMWCLGKTRNVDEVRSMFLRNYEDEIRPCLQVGSAQ